MIRAVRSTVIMHSFFLQFEYFRKQKVLRTKNVKGNFLLIFVGCLCIFLFYIIPTCISVIFVFYISGQYLLMSITLNILHTANLKVKAKTREKNLEGVNFYNVYILLTPQ